LVGVKWRGGTNGVSDGAARSIFAGSIFVGVRVLGAFRGRLAFV
jgi:hypothetical protein